MKTKKQLILIEQSLTPISLDGQIIINSKGELIAFGKTIKDLVPLFYSLSISTAAIAAATHQLKKLNNEKV